MTFNIAGRSTMNRYVLPVITITTILLTPLFTHGDVLQDDTAIYHQKCGTPAILEMMTEGRLAKSAYSRPVTDTSTVSFDGHFRVHYDTTGDNAPNLTDTDENGIPDYVDKTLEYLEYAWNLQIDQLHYMEPLSDNSAGGDDKVDFYIQDLGSGSYGYTMPESAVNGSAPSYCVIDNDFQGTQYATTGLEALKVTTAHEFFHVIHFSYFHRPTLYNKYPLLWWMEQTAVWMEDRAWDDVNDYLAYLKTYFQNATIFSIDYNTSLFIYGSGVWPMYLAARHGDDQIRLIWQTLSESPSPGIADFDIPIVQKTSGASNLAASFNEFAVWNWFTGDRANPDDFFHDSGLFDVEMQADSLVTSAPSTLPANLKNMTSRYYEYLFVGDWDMPATLTLSASSATGEYAGSVILYNTPYDYEVHRLDGMEDEITISKPFQKAIWVVSCTNTTSGTHAFTLDADIHSAVNVEEKPVYALKLNGAFPNPFNPATTISFSLDRPATVNVYIYNAAGQKVTELFNGPLDAGLKQLLWKPSDLSAGVYFVRIAAGDNVLTDKMLYLK